MPTGPTRTLAIRLALREEGTMWNAYMAQEGTMEGAKLIGSIVVGAVATDAEIKAAFMDLMKGVMALAVKEVTGEEVKEWGTKPAPKSERGGNA